MSVSSEDTLRSLENEAIPSVSRSSEQHVVLPPVSEGTCGVLTDFSLPRITSCHSKPETEDDLFKRSAHEGRRP